jgi:hypothetical protein
MFLIIFSLSESSSPSEISSRSVSSASSNVSDSNSEFTSISGSKYSEAELELESFSPYISEVEGGLDGRDEYGFRTRAPFEERELTLLGYLRAGRIILAIAADAQAVRESGRKRRG